MVGAIPSDIAKKRGGFLKEYENQKPYLMYIRYGFLKRAKRFYFTLP